MKQKSYNEGPEVAEKFEQAMKLLFRTPKPETEPKKERTPKATSVRKTKRSDKD
jgi:hypothetical protein